MKVRNLLAPLILASVLGTPAQAQSEFIYLTAVPMSGPLNEWGPGAKPQYFSNVVMACDQPETAISQAEQQFHPGLHHSYDGNEFLVSWEFHRSECFATEEEAEQDRKSEYDRVKREAGWSPVWFSFRFTRND